MNIKAGQKLLIKPAHVLLPEDRLRLERLGLRRQECDVWVTFVDSLGASFYIRRISADFPGDVEGFIPAQGVGFVNASTFFEPTAEFCAAYAGGRHCSRKLFNP